MLSDFHLTIGTLTQPPPHVTHIPAVGVAQDNVLLHLLLTFLILPELKGLFENEQWMCSWAFLGSRKRSGIFLGKANFSLLRNLHMWLHVWHEINVSAHVPQQLGTRSGCNMTLAAKTFKKLPRLFVLDAGAA